MSKGALANPLGESISYTLHVEKWLLVKRWHQVFTEQFLQSPVNSRRGLCSACTLTRHVKYGVAICAHRLPLLTSLPQGAVTEEREECREKRHSAIRNQDRGGRPCRNEAERLIRPGQLGTNKISDWPSCHGWVPVEGPHLMDPDSKNRTNVESVLLGR